MEYIITKMNRRAEKFETIRQSVSEAESIIKSFYPNKAVREKVLTILYNSIVTANEEAHILKAN